MPADTSSDPVPFELPYGLHRHASRPQWGYAIAVQQRDGVTEWQFQDGKLRRIGQAFCHLLQAVDLPAHEDERIGAELIARAGLTAARRKRAAEDGAPLLTFDEQVARFLLRYPDGFEDEAWQKDQRGETAKRRLKRHRAPAIVAAQEQLAESALRTHLERGEAQQVVQRVIDVLSDCNLVTKKALSLFDHMRPSDSEPLARAWVELLHGDGAIDMRMLRLLTCLRHLGKPNWALVTAPLALVHPSTHITVHPNSFREQAKWMAPHLTLHHQPDGAQYERLRRMALRLHDQLAERGHSPRDLMDVFDFMAVSLKPVKPRGTPTPAPTETVDSKEAVEAA